MKVSQGTKEFAEGFYQGAYGYSQKKFKRGVNTTIAGEAAILNLHRVLGLTANKIAEIHEIDVEHVEKVLQSAQSNAASDITPSSEENSSVS